jgi:hypothetical protein
LSNINFSTNYLVSSELKDKGSIPESPEEREEAINIKDLDFLPPEFEETNVYYWQKTAQKVDQNLNGVNDNFEIKLSEMERNDGTNEPIELSSKDIIEALFGNKKPEPVPNINDIVPIVISFPDGDITSTISLFENLGGDIKYIYDNAINGFAGSLNIEQLNLFQEVLREYGVPFIIEEDSYFKAHLYYASRNMNLRPYVWDTLSYDGDNTSAVAVIDTGIDDSHDFFAPGYSSGNYNYKLVGWRDEVSAQANPYDDNFHGSHCAGIVAGNGSAVLDGTNRTVSTFSLGFDYTGFIIPDSSIPMVAASFNVTEAGTVEVQCDFDDFTPGADNIYVYAYLYYGESIVDQYVAMSSAWTQTLSYVASSSELGGYSLRLTLVFDDNTGDTWVTDPRMRFMGEIHWPFNPSPLGTDNIWNGVAPDTHLVGVKVLDQDGGGQLSDIVDGINWVITNRLVYNITTISMSLGGGPGEASLINAVNNAVNNGIVTVVSAGNDGAPGNNIGSPGDADNVITVAALSNSDNITEYSSSGGLSFTGNTIKPDITGPGGSDYNYSIFSVDSNDNDASGQYPVDGYNNDLAPALGTSMSTPAVAGAANLLIEAMGGRPNWNYTAEEAKRVKALILMTATETYPINREITSSFSPTLERGGKDIHEGYGRINIDAALEAYTRQLTTGTNPSINLVISAINSFEKHALGYYANLNGGEQYQFNLDVPNGADFDLHIYNNTPTSIGEPNMVASSISSTLGGDESIIYTPPSAGKYYVIAKAISGSGFTNITFKGNDYPANVSNGQLTPLTGNQTTLFNFSVIYTDGDDMQPAYINVVINGTDFPMTKEIPSDTNYTDGCLYTYSTYLQSSIFNYTYYFECFDGKFYNDTQMLSNLEVSSIPSLNPPILNNGMVTPPGGTFGTEFVFSVIYTDSDNDAPSEVNTTINATTYPMVKQDILDTNYIDGCIYEYSIILSPGSYGFFFNCSDGTYFASDGPYSGPTVLVSTSLNYTMTVGNPYTWIDATGGTALSLSDDGYSTQALPFSFKYYNVSYSTIYLGANGYLSFTDSTPNDFSNDPIPSGDADNTYLIAPFWDDLLTAFAGGGGTIYVQSFGTYWVAEWLNIQHIGGPVVGTFEVVLYDSGDIVFNYDYISSVAGGYTCGLNYGVNTSFYNSYQGLTASTNDLSILFSANDYPPQLSSGGVNPSSGNQTTLFNFNVVYTDFDNNAPSSVNVIINGTAYPMTKQNPGDTVYTDGCVYEYTTMIATNAFNYTYFFNCSDGKYSDSTSTYNLEVIEVNTLAPILSNGMVNPPLGYNYFTSFEFSVNYSDLENNAPSLINVTINSTTYDLVKQNPGDINYMDGCIYVFNTFLNNTGVYNYTFNCFDGAFIDTLGPFIGPTVSYPGINAINITSPTNTTYFSFNPEYYPSTYGFENDSAGTVPVGWTSIEPAGCTVELIDIIGGHGKVVGLFDGSVAAAPRFENVISRTTGTIEFWMRTQDALQPNMFLLEDGSAADCIELVIMNNEFRYYDGGWNSIGQAASINQWYHISVEFNVSIGWYLWIDGVQQNVVPYPFLGNPTLMDTVDFTTGSSAATGYYMYVDAVGYSWDPNYQLGDNIVPGVLLNYSTLFIPDSIRYSLDSQLNVTISGTTAIPITVDGLHTLQVFANSSFGIWYESELLYFTTNVINDNAPTLTNEMVNPTVGNQNTLFNFTIEYSDYDNNAPLYINVSINGTDYAMVKQNPAEINYTDGCLYQYITFLNPNPFNYSFFFQCYDGNFSSSTLVFNNLNVTLVNDYTPELQIPQLNPSIGTNNTLFDFSVWYYDQDNNLPLYVNITINATGLFSMEKRFPLDINATDGILYYYNTTLPFGYYQFEIDCSDGTFLNSTGWIVGPEVNPFFSIKTGPIKIVVLQSASSVAPRNALWDELNTNWNSYGTYNITIDYTILNIAGITYNDLVNTNADVVVIADAWGTYDYTLAEINAIMQYVQEGRGLLGSGVSYWSAPNNILYLAPIFGLRNDMVIGIPQPANTLDIDPLGYGYSSTIMFNNFTTPMESYAGYALDGWRLNLTDPGEIAAAYVGAPISNLSSVFNGAGIIVHEGGSAGLGRAVYATHLSSYNFGGTWTVEETQFYYNLLVYTALKNAKISSAVNLIAPTNNSNLFNDFQNFTWDSLEAYFGPSNYTLQVSNTTDFSSVLVEKVNIVETPGTTNTTALINLTSGIYYWRVRPTYGIFNGNWSEIYQFTLITNDYDPSLTYPNVNPVNGSQWTQFNFTIIYTDLDNNSALYINVIINGTIYNMTKVNASDNNYIDGCEYQYITTILPNMFNYTYYFNCSDGKNTNSTVIKNDLQVIEISLFPPQLINPQVTPQSGDNNTLYNFTVWYYDLDNNLPKIINVTINGTGTFLMVKASPSDNNATDGIQYYYNITLTWGSYQFQMNCTDGFSNNYTSWIFGPEINPFKTGPSIVAVLNSDSSNQPSYWQGGWANNYLPMLNGLIGAGLNATAITNAEILAGGLDNIGTLIMVDNCPNDAASLVVETWAEAGGTLITFDSSICFLNWAGLLPPESEGSNGYNTYWEYSSAGSGRCFNDVHPVMNGYVYDQVISGTAGDSRYYSATIAGTSAGAYYTILVKETLVSNFDLVVALDAPWAGKIVHSWDAQHWGTASNQQMILNAINWVNPGGTYKVDLLNPANDSIVYNGLNNFSWTSLEPYFGPVNYTLQISNTSDFSTINIEQTQILETPVNTTVLIDVNLPPGLYYWRVCANYDVFKSNWSDIYTFNLIINNFSPSLSSEEVLPINGTQYTTFNFTVLYTDLDNNPPININVTINGTLYSMNQVNPLDTNYSDGCVFQYVTKLSPAIFNYTYYFYSSDGKYSNSTSIRNDLQVIEVNLFPPQLINPQVSPVIGDNNTLFNFTVWYYDLDNNLPDIINITINGTGTFLMVKAYSSDNNATDGILYYYNTTLVWGSYQFQINCFDGLFLNSTVWNLGPIIDPFEGCYSGSQILFYDDFERASLGSDWTPIGGGSSGINTDTFQSPTRSAYHCWSVGEIQSRSFDLSIYVSANVSYWVRQGDLSIGSEQPDGGEDFYVEYYNNVGGWSILDQFLGADPGATIYIRYRQLPANALHSGFQLRFRQSGGSGSDFDWWHFDDVQIDVASQGTSTDLYVPTNDTTIFTGLITFTWESLEEYFGPSNYTIQISNTIDFSSIDIQQTDIPETPTQTSRIIDVNLLGGQYYWRVRPIYGQFYGNWSEIYTFNLIVNNFAPELINPQVTPTLGNDNTLFNYTVWYYDDDNNLPADVNVTIDSITYSMVSANPADLDATDGILYYYNTTLAIGYHQFQMNCSDGKYLNSTSWVNEPTVDPFYGLIPNGITLLLPFNETTLFSGINIFIWESLEPAFGSVNYTFQISNVSDYSIIIQENTSILETAVNTLFMTDLYLPEIQYYWRVRPTYDVFNGSWSYNNLSFFFEINDYAPVLSNEAVDLLSGNQHTVFNFTVNYTDQDDNAPAYIMVELNGSWYFMTKQNPLDNNYTDGCIYNVSIKLAPSLFNYTYSFNCSDGKFANTTIVYNNLEVKEVSWYYPQLMNPQVNPSIGNGTTLFNFTVSIYDADNNLPISINITIGSTTYLMVEVNASDLNTTDGKDYYFNTTLGFGIYQFQINCSDMSLTNATNWISGPSVNPFYGLSPVYTVNLLTPVNDTTFFNGFINFTWSSLEAPFGSVNYTLWISNISDYSTLVYENTTILEVSGVSSKYMLVNFSTGLYYWRVRPTYGVFNGSWTDNFTFYQIVNDKAPELASGSVDPTVGDQHTLFNFTVIYTDQDNNPPVYQWQFLCYD